MAAPGKEGDRFFELRVDGELTDAQLDYLCDRLHRVVRWHQVNGLQFPVDRPRAKVGARLLERWDVPYTLVETWRSPARPDEAEELDGPHLDEQSRGT